MFLETALMGIELTGKNIAGSAVQVSTSYATGNAQIHLLPLMAK